MKREWARRIKELAFKRYVEDKPLTPAERRELDEIKRKVVTDRARSAYRIP